jgi:hypothetical protein
MTTPRREWFVEKGRNGPNSYTIFKENDIRDHNGNVISAGHPAQLFTVYLGDTHFDEYVQLICNIPHYLDLLDKYEDALLTIRSVLGPSVPRCLTQEDSCMGCAAEWADALRAATDALADLDLDETSQPALNELTQEAQSLNFGYNKDEDIERDLTDGY